MIWNTGLLVLSNPKLTYRAINVTNISKNIVTKNYIVHFGCNYCTENPVGNAISAEFRVGSQSHMLDRQTSNVFKTAQIFKVPILTTVFTRNGLTVDCLRYGPGSREPEET